MLRVLNWLLTLILNHPLIFWLCMAANTVGVIWGGWLWYGPQLAAAPAWAWPFIPDCPEAALWATIAFLGLRYQRRWGWFNAFAAFASIKYGLWTLAFWSRHWSQLGFVADYWPLEVMLFVAHIGLTCEGLLLATRIGTLSLPARLSIIGWYALSIFVDYGLGHHPPLTAVVPVTYVFWVAIALTTTIGALLLWLPYDLASYNAEETPTKPVTPRV